MVKQTIPGPKEWPWIGSVQRIIDNPPEFFTELAQKYGAISRFTMMGFRVLLVSDPALIREVLVERSDEFPKSPRDIAIMSPYFGRGLLLNNGDSHRKQRKLVQPAFHHKRIQAYGDIMVDYTQDMVATWQDGEVRNISEEFMRLTLYIVAKSLFKEDPTQMAKIAETIGHAVDEMQAMVDKDFEAPWMPPLSWPTPGNRQRRAIRKAFHTTVDAIIENRLAGTTDNTDNKVEDRGDLLSMLLLSKDETGKGLALEEVRDETLTILLAGHETTANALTWTFYLLAQHPEAAAKLYEEVDRVLAGRGPEMADLPNLPYTAQVVKESMRLHPPAWVLNSRRVQADTTIGDYRVSRGTEIFISPYAMHRLTDYYEAPDEFRPERFTPEFEDSLPRFAYMPFGGGPRVCIGNSFAMMEAQLILATVSSQFALNLLPGTVVDHVAQITLSVKGGLSMQVVARGAKEAKLSGVEAQDELVAS